MGIFCGSFLFLTNTIENMFCTSRKYSETKNKTKNLFDEYVMKFCKNWFFRPKSDHAFKNVQEMR
jgi:hypothetical protein